MEFFQTLIRPDREENSQRAEVCKAANHLQVGEFQFLQLAYREWHKDEMPEELSNSIFKSYMLRDEVPHWARHYGRRIISPITHCDNQSPSKGPGVTNPG